MFPVPADVRKLMYHVKHAQGVDIPRIFCGLNDVRNIIPDIHYALDAGMTPQATLCITTSPIHTAEYYSEIADKLIAEGAPEICLKDMAGIGQPAMLGRLRGNDKGKTSRNNNTVPRTSARPFDGFNTGSLPRRCRHNRHCCRTAFVGKDTPGHYLRAKHTPQERRLRRLPKSTWTLTWRYVRSPRSSSTTSLAVS